MSGHNGGPPLEEPRHRPPWGRDDIRIHLAWTAAHRRAWRPPSAEIALRRLERAERLGLSYEEYVLELLERGRHLQSEDVERIDAIKANRKRRRRSS